MRAALLVPLLAGCASTQAIQAVAPGPSIENHPVRGTDRFRVVTHGLPLEIAVEGVEVADVLLARDVLEATLTALGGKAPVPGTDLDLDMGRARVRVKLISAAGGDLWVVDTPSTGPGAAPLRALATAAVARGFRAWEAGEPEGARRLAIESVRLFPGDPLQVQSTPGESVAANPQNHLGWALLASLSDGVERERFLVSALDRSPSFLAARLGAWPDELLEADAQDLFRTARSLVEETLGNVGAHDLTRSVVEVPSPIVGTGGERPLAVLPRPFLGLYFEGEAARGLENGPLVGIAVEAFQRLRGDPVELLLATAEVHSIYLTDDWFREAPAPGGNEPWRPILSALLADVARKAAAGLTPLEIAATLHADVEPEAHAWALVKLTEQRQRESAWYAEALQSVER